MHINSKLLHSFLLDNKKHIINKKISDICLINSRLFMFTLRNEDKKLIIDLDNVHPYIALLSTDFNQLSLPNSFLYKLKQKGHPIIKDIEVINNDKIIKITTSTIDCYYHQLTFYLYIELFNGHANMILTDKDNNIIAAFYETNLLSTRIIRAHHKYVLPIKKEENIEHINLDEYIEYTNKLFINGINKRKKELYGEIIKKETKRLKYLNKKLNNLKLDKENAYKNIEYKNIGNELLMNINNIKKGDTSFNNYHLDPNKSPSENINIYFAKYKKAVRSLKIIDELIAKCLEEIDETTYNIDFFNLSKEDEISLLIEEKKKKKEIYKAYQPYFIRYKGVDYLYGKSAISNDYLTFKMFKRNSKVTFMHIKDYPSSHLIINKLNPSNLELEIGSNLLLFLNNLESADVIYTNRENITRSNGLGKVNLLNYKTITIHKRNEEIKDLLKYEKRVKD